MGIINKATAQRLQKQVIGELDPRGLELAGALYNQFNTFHTNGCWDDPEIEQMLVKQRVYELGNEGWFSNEGLVLFSPSSASKCERELCFKAIKAKKDTRTMLPYQRRWVRNSTAVHEAVQRDMLYMTKTMKDPAFTVMFTDDGLPMWEKNNAQKKMFEHNGVKFGLAGMMDGQLKYKDGSTIGFEFKTKSNSVAQVGQFKMKDITQQHKDQCIGYSLLFGMDEFIVMYEAVAKDGWMKGEEARSDIRTFYVKVTESERTVLLDKFSRIALSVEAEKLRPYEPEKCLFCEFKTSCGCGVK